MQLQLSIRSTVPLLMLVFVGTVLIISYWSSRNLGAGRVLEYGINAAHRHLNLLQGVASQYLQYGGENSIQKLVSSVSAEPDTRTIFITDATGTILAAHSNSLIGKSWREEFPESAMGRLQKVLDTRTSDVWRDEATDMLYGLTSLCTVGAVQSFLRSQDCGFIYYTLDLDTRYRLMAQGLRQQTLYVGVGVIFVAIVMAMLITLVVTRRTRKIAQAMSAFASHDRNIRLAVVGDDELAHLSAALNTMFQQISDADMAIRDKEERLRAIFTTVLECVISINARGIVESINPAGEQMFGFQASEIIGRNVSMLMPDDFRVNHDTYLKNYHQTGIRKIIGIGREISGRRKDGSVFPMDLAITEMSIGGARYYTGVIRDATQRKQLERDLIAANAELQSANQQLAKAANTDGLTGLFNRRYFDLTLENEIRRATRSLQPVSLCICDIDFFKTYNDALGHQAGDACLQKVAAIMMQVFQRAGDTTARYGGEEFVIILTETSEEQAWMCAQGLRNVLHDARIPHPRSVVADHVTLSIGIATYCPVDDSVSIPEVSLLLEAADKALYQAKQQGRNRICKGSMNSEQPPDNVLKFKK